MAKQCNPPVVEFPCKFLVIQEAVYTELHRWIVVLWKQQLPSVSNIVGLIIRDLAESVVEVLVDTKV